MARVLSLTRVINRSLLRVRPGPSNPGSNQAAEFLQGLITNDMRHLQEGNEVRSMFAMLLNAKGRILFDALIYSTRERGAYLLECDRSVSERLARHLKMFRVRRDIEVDSDDTAVWSLYDPNTDHIIDVDKLDLDRVRQYNDPRLGRLGVRIVGPNDLSDEDLARSIMEQVKDATVECVHQDNYRSFRYRLGVGEGSSEIPLETSFPLEANCDYLHGVSFHKGCYVGQELTARTHHTGVVRKRLMPLFFKNEINRPIPDDTPVYSSTDEKKSIGKVRGVSKNVGLGLLRINEVLAAPSLTVMGNEATTLRPTWWPIEVTKDKIGIQ